MSATAIRRAGMCGAAAFVALTALIWAHPLFPIDLRVDHRLLLGVGERQFLEHLDRRHERHDLLDSLVAYAV